MLNVEGSTHPQVALVGFLALPDRQGHLQTLGAVIVILAENVQHASISSLQSERSNAVEAAASAKQRISAVDAELVRRFGEQGKTALANLGKETGTTTLELENGPKLKADVSKTVKWDGDALAALAADMTWENASHFFEIKFSMKEAMYKAQPPGNFLDSLTAARTVKTGDIKIEFAA